MERLCPYTVVMALFTFVVWLHNLRLGLGRHVWLSQVFFRVSPQPAHAGAISHMAAYGIARWRCQLSRGSAAGRARLHYVSRYLCLFSRCTL